MVICLGIITVSISTMKARRQSLIGRVEIMNLPSWCFVNIISQGEDVEDVSILSQNITLIKSKTLGLSRSRNIGINHCHTEWIWFQDDDFHPVVAGLKEIHEMMDCSELDVLFAKIHSLEEPDKPYKNYDRLSSNFHFISFRASSIEIIVRTSTLRTSGVTFDEFLGLGTELPACEENLFLFNLLKGRKGRVGFSKEPCCLHTTVQADRNIDFAKRYAARGYMLAKTRSFLGIFIALWWVLRGTSDDVPRVSRVNNIIAGYAFARKQAVDAIL